MGGSPAREHECLKRGKNTRWCKWRKHRLWTRICRAGAGCSRLSWSTRAICKSHYERNTGLRHATHLLPLRSYSGAWIGRHDPPLSKEMRDDACTFLSSPLCASSTLAMYLQCGSYGVRR